MVFGRPSGSTTGGRRIRFLALTAAVAATAVACAGGSEPEGVTATPVPRLDAEAPTVTTLPETEADPMQAELVSDGTVTHAEMEAALLAVVACIRAEGYESDLETFVPRLRYEITISGDTGEARDATYNRCTGAFLSQVEDVYFSEHGPSVEEVAVRNQEIVECMAEQNSDVAVAMSVDEAAEIAGIGILVQCEDQVALPLD